MQNAIRKSSFAFYPAKVRRHPSSIVKGGVHPSSRRQRLAVDIDGGHELAQSPQPGSFLINKPRMNSAKHAATDKRLRRPCRLEQPRRQLQGIRV